MDVLDLNLDLDVDAQSSSSRSQSSRTGDVNELEYTISKRPRLKNVKRFSPSPDAPLKRKSLAAGSEHEIPTGYVVKFRDLSTAIDEFVLQTGIVDFKIPSGWKLRPSTNKDEESTENDINPNLIEIKTEDSDVAKSSTATPQRRRSSARKPEMLKKEEKQEVPVRASDNTDDHQITPEKTLPEKQDKRISKPSRKKPKLNSEEQLNLSHDGIKDDSSSMEDTLKKTQLYNKMVVNNAKKRKNTTVLSAPVQLDIKCEPLDNLDNSVSKPEETEKKEEKSKRRSRASHQTSEISEETNQSTRKSRRGKDKIVESVDDKEEETMVSVKLEAIDQEENEVDESEVNKSVRRSGRPRVATEKLKNSENTMKPIVNINPNSALAIKQRIERSSNDDSSKLRKERRSMARRSSVKIPIVDPKREVNEEETINNEVQEVVPRAEGGAESLHIENVKNEPASAATTEETVIKEEIVDIPSPPHPPPPPPPAPPQEPALKARRKSVAIMQPVRSSTRVIKPNRFFDEDYSMTPSIRKAMMPSRSVEKIEKASTVDESSNKEPLVELPKNLKVKLKIGGVDVGVAGTSADSEKKKPKPKGYNIRNGVLTSYVPQMLLPLPNVMVNGQSTNITHAVMGCIDYLLYRVCGDGVKRHSDILTPWQKKKRHSQRSMTHDMDDATRRRIMTKKNLDYLYMPEDYDRFDLSETDYSRSCSPYPFGDNSHMKERDYAEKQSDGDDQKVKKKKRRLISLDRYMKEKNIKNRKETGIKLFDEEPNDEPTNNEYYYRELLTDYPDFNNVADNMDDDSIDIEEVADEGFELGKKLDEVGVQRDSMAMANRIVMMMQRPQPLDGSEHTLEMVISRAAEQPEHAKAVMNEALEVIKQQNLLETSRHYIEYNFESSLYTSTNSNANRLKDVFTMYDKPRQNTIYWVHKFFVENLPVHFLASYLALLRHAKQLTGSFVGHIVKSTQHEPYPWNEVTEMIREHVALKAFDPEIEALQETIEIRALSNTIFLMVSPTLMIGEYWNKERSSDTIFRWLKSIGHPASDVIKANYEDKHPISLAEFVCDVLIQTICEKVRKLLRKYSSARIVLVGYGWSTYAVHRAVLLSHGVSAVISLGFPVKNQLGRRGVADDDILLTYCPTLFVVGTDGEYYDNVAMKDLRSSMLKPSGLVVVGHANDQLLVPPSVLVRLGVTQKVVFRLILERIIEFMGLDETSEEREKLFPIPLNDILNVDPVLFRSEKVQEKQYFQNSIPAPTSVTPAPISAGRRATTSVIDDSPRLNAVPITKKKRQDISTPGSISGIDGARQIFNDVMKKVQIPDSPKRTSPSDSGRTVERGELRDRAMTTPSSLRSPVTPKSVASPVASTDSQGPIDPASISLI